MRGTIYKRLTTERQGRRLFILCFAAYTAAYIGRYNYSTLMAEMADDGVITLGLAGTISMGYFLTYAVGQAAGGMLCQKISPYRAIGIGLTLSGVCNIAMGFVPGQAMLFVWTANGAFQSMLWPPIVRLFAECMPLEQQSRACVNINSSTPVGILLSYLLCAFFLAFTDWRLAFTGSGVILLVMALIWWTGTAPLVGNGVQQRTEAEPKSGSAESSGIVPLLFEAGIFWILVPAAFHGGLKDGVTNWVPTILQGSFGTGASLSAVLSGILPIVSLLGGYAAGWLNVRVFKNEVKTAAVLFTAAAMCVALLIPASQSSLAVSLVLLSGISSAMLGVNTLFVNVLPVRAGRNGGAAALSGVLNAVTYFGASGTVWITGYLAETFGWTAVYQLWLAMSASSCAVSFLAAHHIGSMEKKKVRVTC
ncbi:MAG: MFS transporter [Lachnospiraceae bacterium]|jgi:sugar phosphate permease